MKMKASSFFFCVFRGLIIFMQWQTSRRRINLDRPLVMAILNVTPDSFSDGGQFLSVSDALRRAEAIIAEGADIIDIGGESTRPGSSRVSIDEETRRTSPVIEAIAKRFDTPISIDTTKSEVARRAVDAGAEIINDISGLRFDPKLADVAAASKAGLVLMHSRGTFETMHTQPAVEDILADIKTDFLRAITWAKERGVTDGHIALDVGIGFGKTQTQNLELLAKLDIIVSEFADYPLLVGTSRKSFIGKVLDGVVAEGRVSGSITSVAIAVFNGARIVRVHDVKESVDAMKIADAIRQGR